MNLRLNYAIRTLPLIVYGLILTYWISFSFDFWTSMIDINKNIINWFLAGVFNVILIFLFFYVRLFIIKLSFQDLNRRIPHSDLWEKIQFLITIFFIILVVVNGLLLTVYIFDAKTFQWIQFGLIVVPYIIDLLFHLKWILL